MAGSNSVIEIEISPATKMASTIVKPKRLFCLRCILFLSLNLSVQDSFLGNLAIEAVANRDQL